MPLGVLGAVAIGTTAGTTAAGVYGAHKSAKAAEKAAETQAQADAAALEFEKEKERRRQEEWDRMMAQEEARWYAEQERLAPYRAASEGALAQLVSLAGLPAYKPQPIKKPDFNRPMPEGWEPGDPTGLEDEFAQARTPVRKPSNARLADLLTEHPLAHDIVSAALSAVESQRRPVRGDDYDISEEAYQRIADTPAASLRFGPFGSVSSARVADLLRAIARPPDAGFDYAAERQRRYPRDVGAAYGVA